MWKPYRSTQAEISPHPVPRPARTRGEGTWLLDLCADKGSLGIARTAPSPRTFDQVVRLFAFSSDHGRQELHLDVGATHAESGYGMGWA